MLRTPRTPWPANVPVTQQAPPAPPPGGIAVTYVGHASFILQTPDGNILTDPIWSDRASPVSFAGPRRHRAPGVRLEDLPPISLVLLSHNHYDHCDLPTLRALARSHHPSAITSLGNAHLLRSSGFDRVEEFDWWESAAKPLKVTLTPAQHFSGRTPFDRNQALWCGFFLEVAGRKLYFAADTGYGPHFKEINARLGAPDLALLPIGHYEPRWFMKDIHVNPAESVQAHVDTGSKLSVPMHFGTFRMTPEGFDTPLMDLRQALKERGLPNAFRVLEPGETLIL